MAFPTDWDVDQYRDEHSPPEHWRLCRQFMVQNKDRFPEPRLVCLAQCFCNMEFLGCRYPEETMSAVRELAAGIVDDYREKKKSKIQRTFVKASDAAEAKVTKKRPSYGTPGGDSNPAKMPRLSGPISEADRKGNSSAFILLDYEGQTDVNPISKLMCSSGFCKVPVDFHYGADGDMAQCQVVIGGDVVAMASDPTRAGAKLAAATAALADLQTRCYTINLKVKVLSDQSVLRREITTAGDHEDNRVAADSVGGKLLAMMGWDGGGLGKNQQGITQPVRLADVVGRQGLGSQERGVTREFKNNVEVKMREYASRFQERDLSFSAEFSNEERKEIHHIAHRFHLKSKSYGKDADRYLVVSHKFNPYHLLRYLQGTGGETDKYALIPPKCPTGRD